MGASGAKQVRRKVLRRYRVDATYERTYNEWFYNQHSDKLVGLVLDVGAKRDNEEHYRTLSSSIDAYVSIDPSPVGELDLVGDGRALPVRDETVDAIILSEVIEHIPIEELPGFLREMRRVLKPGGYLLANVPFIYPVHGAADYNRPTFHGLAHILESCGFSYEIWLGGSYVEVPLHVLDRPIRRLCETVGIDLPLYAFSLFHYLVLLLAWLPGKLLRSLYGGRNPISDYWYVTQFVVASPSHKKS